ncbi:hypothetical protein GQ54DRAFT_305019 [Martensiomyces pterosporus]|nr:hypothetical protein GQ54DRAFT_305019 [Martensiomyces pterosporus]
MLAQHRERQKKLLPLFSPELRAMRMAFAKGLWQMFIIFTVVFWISISFLFGAGYDTTRHMKDAKVILRDFDQSKASTLLSTMVTHTVDTQPAMFNLVDETNSTKYGDFDSVHQAVWDGDAWAAIVINKGFGANLTNALTKGAAYEPSKAVTLVTEESRHYFKVQAVSKTAEGVLAALQGPFAQAVFKTVASADGANVTQVIDRANPLALVLPFSFTTDNIAPYHFDMSMYILSVTLSLGMVIGSFIPSNMWKTIEEPFYKQVKVVQVIGLRLFINVAWAFIICLQETGIVFAFRGPSWSPTVGDFFGIFGILLLNTFAFTFYIDCLQNWIHPRFLLAAYFTTLFVNISAAIFGTELNNHFFRILYATPFLNSGFTLRTLLTRGSYDKIKFSVTINVLWSVFWWVLSTFLIARKARLVRAGKLLMANIPPPPQPAPAQAPQAAAGEKEKAPGEPEEGYASSVSSSALSSSQSRLVSHQSLTDGTVEQRRKPKDETSDIEIEDM